MNLESNAATAILERAIRTWGASRQTQHAVQEAGEFIAAIMRHTEGRYGDDWEVGRRDNAEYAAQIANPEATS